MAKRKVSTMTVQDVACTATQHMVNEANSGKLAEELAKGLPATFQIGDVVTVSYRVSVKIGK